MKSRVEVCRMIDKLLFLLRTVGLDVEGRVVDSVSRRVLRERVRQLEWVLDG